MGHGNGARTKVRQAFLPVCLWRLLDHLVSADGVAPHRLGHIAPAGGVVQEYVMLIGVDSFEKRERSE